MLYKGQFIFTLQTVSVAFGLPARDGSDTQGKYKKLFGWLFSSSCRLICSILVVLSRAFIIVYDVISLSISGRVVCTH